MSDRTTPDGTLNALVEMGRLTLEAAQNAQTEGMAHNVNPLQLLVTGKVITPVDVVQANCHAAGLEFVELLDYDLDVVAISLLKGSYAKRHNVLPIWQDGERVKVAVTHSNAGNLPLRDEIQRLTKHTVEFVVAMKDDLLAKINKTYRADGELAQLVGKFDDEPEEDLSTITQAEVEDGPIVQFVNLLITQAIDDGASDIHLEPGEHDLRVRYRIDGVLKDASRQPRQAMAALISRVKIMSNMNIAEKRVPQDGRLSVIHKGHKIDLRVASLPTVWGYEKIVMRVLDNSTAQMSLDDLGFTEDNFRRYEKSYIKPHGLVLVTGPTGSGKSTTLYATVNIVSKPEVNVITVEDPVEYRIPDINQVQVNNKSGMTFAAALKSILRSDPDIVLIGEIRDRETAQIAVEAALTGHLVLSTLHTNDAPSAVTRLIEMGIEPFLVGSALDAVLAQRLCRRLCKKCRVQYTPTEEELSSLNQFPWSPGEPLPQLYRPAEGGCNSCSATGFKGRMALHEIMSVSEEIERLAVSQSSSDDIGRVAVDQGMQTLRQDGWHKVMLGHTSIGEVLRVAV